MLRILAKSFHDAAARVVRLRAANDGATAVEFALIAPAFLATLFAVIQMTLYLFAQQTLQSAAVQASRTFMTGSAQTSGLTQAQLQTQFNTSVCTLVQALLNCSNLQIDVSAYDSFSSASTTTPALYNSDGTLITTGTFATGTQSQIMVIQLVYPWPIFGIPLGSLLPNSGYGTAVLMGVTAFQVEPYS